MEFNLTNYHDHPQNSYYTVFFFRTQDQADHFESLLKENGIEYEKADKEEEDTKYFFAVRNDVRKDAIRLNYLVSAKFRKPFLPRRAGWLVVILTLAAIALAIIGQWFKS